MKNLLTTFPLSLSALVLGVCLAATASAQDKKPLSREDAVRVSITAQVQAIDQAKREVTLKGPLGNEVTFIVDKRVKRLNEIKVGDLVEADYFVAFAAEVRPPTQEEKSNPLIVLEERARAPRGTDPAGGGLRIMKAVVTIEGLDRPTKSLTVAGPAGRLHTVQVENVANLSKLRLGETIVVTYAEALAVSLEKREPKATD